MWKYLAIFIVILGITVYVENQRDAEHASPSSSTISSSMNDVQTTDNANQPKRKLSGWRIFFTWPDSTAAGAVFLTLFAIAEQTQANRDSIVVTKIAADAALLNAQAVINAERARLLFLVEKKLDSKRPGIGIFSIFAVNYGRTPAELIGVSDAMDKIKNSPNDISPVAQDLPKEKTEQRYILPNERYLVARFIPASTQYTV